jgi:hypothetical protein
MTTRNLTAAVGSLMSEQTYGLRVLAHISLNSETLYLQTAVGNLVVNTITYAGVGQLGGVDRISEDLERFTPGVKLWLSAHSSSLLSETLSENLFNKDVKLYRAFLRDSALVNTPELWFRGKVGEINLYRGDQERGDYIEVMCRTRLKKENKSSYYTREDLWLTYSGDTGFDYHAQIPGFKGRWGQYITLFSSRESAQASRDNFIAPYLDLFN